jgi:hypothetical protein
LYYGEDTASLRVLAKSLLACFGLRFRGLFNFFFVVGNELIEAEVSSTGSGKQRPLERRVLRWWWRKIGADTARFIRGLTGSELSRKRGSVLAKSYNDAPASTCGPSGGDSLRAGNSSLDAFGLGFRCFGDSADRPLLRTVGADNPTEVNPAEDGSLVIWAPFNHGLLYERDARGCRSHFAICLSAMCDLSCV